jgi:hypothetical protein
MTRGAALETVLTQRHGADQRWAELLTPAALIRREPSVPSITTENRGLQGSWMHDMTARTIELSHARARADVGCNRSSVTLDEPPHTDRTALVERRHRELHQRSVREATGS